MAIFRGTGGAGDASGGISINEVTEQATNAAASATSAANSATAASTSASSAATSASAADTSATSASTSASNAATSASAASTSETNAGASASAASASETAAAASESAAATSESNAAASASAASTSETNAANSASAASTSETNAAGSESAAATSASNASTSESNAATSASAASTSASNAATSESNAASSASAAATSASNAAASAASINPDNIDINGGTIDGTTIGGTTPDAGTFTNLTATGTVTIPDNAISGDKVEGGTINAITINTLSAGNLAYTGTLTGGTGVVNIGSGQVYKDASGNVGIGTSSPRGVLDVNSSDPQTVYIGDSTDGVMLGHSGANSFLSLGTVAVGARAKLNFDRATGSFTYSQGVFGAETERLRITSTGNVGIGTSSPEVKLDVAGDILINNNSYLYGENSLGNNSKLIGRASDDTLYVGDSAYNNPTIIQAGSNYVGINTAGTERMRIDSSGNLLVGTTSPNNSSSIGLTLTPDGGISFTTSNTGTQFPCAFRRGGNLVGSIRTDTTTTSYVTSSDYRLKEDWVSVADASTRVNALKPVNFAWKVDGKRVDGFLAHELAEVVPEAVTGEKDAVDAEGNPVYQGIDQSKLVPLLTAALQEALAEINSLKARLDAANL